MQITKFFSDIQIKQWILKEVKHLYSYFTIYDYNEREVYFYENHNKTWTIELIYDSKKGDIKNQSLKDIIYFVTEFNPLFIYSHRHKTATSNTINYKDTLYYQEIKQLQYIWGNAYLSPKEMILLVEDTIPFYRNLFKKNQFHHYQLYCFNKNFQKFLFKMELLFKQIEEYYNSEKYHTNIILPYMNDELRQKFPNQCL